MGLWIALVAAAFAIPPAAPKPRLPEPAYTYDGAEICYASGLRVHAIRRPGTNVVSVATVIGGGRAAETDDTRGAAVLAPRLWLRSRPGGGAVTVSDGAAGLAITVETRADASVFVTTGSPADLDGLLALEARRFLHPLEGVDETAFALERDLALQRNAAANESGVLTAGHHLATLLWPDGHPYRAGPLTAEELRSVTLEDVHAFASTWSVASSSLRVEGPYEADTLVAALDRTFPTEILGERAACEAPAADQAPPDPHHAFIWTPARVERPVIVIAWSLPPAWTEDEGTARRAVSRLGGFVKRAVPWAAGVSWDEVDGTCAYLPGELASTARCTIEVPREANQQEVLRIIATQLPDQWSLASRTQVDDDVLPSPSAYLTAFRDLDAMSHGALANRAHWTHHGWIDPLAPSLDDLTDRDNDAVREFAKQWLGPKRMVGVVLTPGPAAAAEAWPARLDGTARLDAPGGSSWRPAVPSGAVRESALDNGLRLWAVERPEMPHLARSSLVWTGGWATVAVPGQAEVVAYVVKGTSGKTIPTGVSTGTAFASASGVRTGRSPWENLDAQLSSHRSWLERRGLDDAKRHSRLDAALGGKDLRYLHRPWVLAAAIRSQHLFPEDVAGMPAWERIREARYVKERLIAVWEREVFRPSNAVLVVAGPMTTEQIEPVADRYLGGWRERREVEPAPARPLPAAPERQAFLLDASRTLTEVRVTCRIPARTDDTAAPLAVLEALLERGLDQSLRETGATLDPAVHLAPLDERVGLITLAADVHPDHEALTAATLLDLLRAIEAGASEPSVAWARQTALGAHARRFANGARTVDLLSEVAAEGRTLEGLERLPAAIEAVDAASVAALLGDCVGHEAITIVGRDPDAPDGVAAEEVDWGAMGRELEASLR